MLIDRSFSRLYCVRGAGFDFNEAQHIFVPADEVNFSTAPRRSEVAGDDDVAKTAKIEIRVLFTAASSMEMDRPFVGYRQFVVEPIKTADDGVRESAGHASDSMKFQQGWM